MAEDKTDWGGLALKAGIAAGAYFLIIKPVLTDVGLQPSASTVAVNNATSTPGTPFDPNFYNAQKGNITIMTVTSAQAYATIIYNALDTWIFNDFNAVYGVFTSLKTQGQVSFLAYIFQQMYGKDLMTWLQYANSVLATTTLPAGLAMGGLNSNEVNQIITYVNQLPNT